MWRSFTHSVKTLIKAMCRNTLAQVNTYSLPVHQLVLLSYFLFHVSNYVCRCTIGKGTQFIIKPPLFAFPLRAPCRHCLHPHPCCLVFYFMKNKVIILHQNSLSSPTCMQSLLKLNYNSAMNRLKSVISRYFVPFLCLTVDHHNIRLRSYEPFSF